MPKKGANKQTKPAVIVKDSPKTRVRKSTKKQAKAKTKEETRKSSKIPGSFKLSVDAFKTIKKFWKPLIGIVVVYSLLNLIFANGLINSVKSTVEDIQKDSFATSASGFGDVIANAGFSNNSSVAQTILFIFETMVIVYALRHLIAGDKLGIKQAYYESTFPLIPLVLVLFVIVLQLIPFSLSAAVLALVLSGLFGSGSMLTVIISLIFILLTAWSLYMFSSSIFAIYIVTLPNMAPLQALKAAKNLVKYRRWPIIRRLMFLPILVTFILGLLIIPLIMFAHVLVAPVFFALSMLAVLYAHTYLYNLYRGLLS
jgi:hypothetical protein